MPQLLAGGVDQDEAVPRQAGVHAFVEGVVGLGDGVVVQQVGAGDTEAVQVGLDSSLGRLVVSKNGREGPSVRPTVPATSGQGIISHEMGHAFGLAHRRQLTLMHTYIAGTGVLWAARG